MDVLAVRNRLREACEKAGSQAAFARLAGVSAPYLSDVLSGARAPGDNILAALALERVVTYRRRVVGKERTGG